MYGMYVQDGRQQFLLLLVLPVRAGQGLRWKPEENLTKGYLCLKCQSGLVLLSSFLLLLSEQVKGGLFYLFSFHVAACLERPPAAWRVHFTPHQWIMFIYINGFFQTPDLVCSTICVRHHYCVFVRCSEKAYKSCLMTSVALATASHRDKFDRVCQVEAGRLREREGNSSDVSWGGLGGITKGKVEKKAHFRATQHAQDFCAD